MNIRLFHQNYTQMITAKKYIEYSIILFPLLANTAIVCCMGGANDIRLTARLLSYLSLKTLLLLTNILVNFLFTSNRKALIKY